MIETLVNVFSVLPGLGSRSARRIVLYLLGGKKDLTKHMGSLLQEIADKIMVCSICNNVDEFSPCNICSNNKRNRSILCVVDSIEDLWNIEESGHHNGLYHVLTRKCKDGCNVSQIEAQPLLDNLTHNKDIKEIILANNPTVSGQTGIFYVTDMVQQYCKTHTREIYITALGRGIPIGSEINYLDESTLREAFRYRKSV